jgi:two-component system OmpR family response regulator
MRLLLVEDDPVLGGGLRDYLRYRGHVVDWLTTLGQASAAISDPVDMILLDWRLPDGSGVEWLGALRARGSVLPVVIMTARDTLNDRIRGLDGGADDYLVKPFAPEELEARIRALARRVVAKGAQETFVGDLRVRAATRQVFRGDQPVELTARETELFMALVARRGRMVSKGDLQALLTGFDTDWNSNSLEVHVSRLRRKLGRDVIETSRGMGYRIP